MKYFKNYKKTFSKIFLTLSLLLLFRVISHIPVPFVDASSMKVLSSYSLFVFADEFSGGTLSSLTFTAVSISSYLTASIVIQLLTAGLSELNEISKLPGGEKTIKNMTLITSILISFVSSIGIIKLFQTKTDILTNSHFYALLIIALCHCVGTVITALIGETINNKGIGNGISLLVGLNIALSFPSKIKSMFGFDNNVVMLITVLIFAVFFAVALFDFLEVSIPVNYALNQTGLNYKAFDSGFPIKINISNVMPLIFTFTIFQFADTILRSFKINAPDILLNILKTNTLPNMIATVIMIYLFTFFYSVVIFDAEEISKYFQFNEANIEGVDVGSKTEKYLKSKFLILNTISATGTSGLFIVSTLGFAALGFASVSISSLMIFAGIASEMCIKLKSEFKYSNYRLPKHLV